LLETVEEQATDSPSPELGMNPKEVNVSTSRLSSAQEAEEKSHEEAFMLNYLR